MNELARMTTVEARDAFRTARVAILPIGATEQHGPHLELRTDTAIASRLACRLAEALGRDAVLLPEVSYGLSEHHLDFSGTLTLRPSTLRALLLDIFESVRVNGIQRVMVINGHGGNIDAVRLAAREALRDLEMHVAQLMWAQLGKDVIPREAGGSWRRNHACEIETSIAMVLDDSLVRHDKIVPAQLKSPRDAFTEPTNAYVDLPIWFDAWTASGSLGDPTRASVDRGARIIDAVASNALAFARQFVEGRPAQKDERSGPHASISTDSQHVMEDRS